MAANESNYRQLGQEEEFSEKGDHDNKTPPLQSPYLRINFLASHIFLFGIYVLALYFVWNRDPSFTACDTKLSTYSPALPHIIYQTAKHFNATIIQSNPYRGPPSPEIDAAWLRIGAGTPGIRLFDEDLKRLNKSTSDELKPLHRIPEEYGGGYMGMLEVFHLLHCLNGLRKATWREYYAGEWGDRSGEDGDGGWRVHTDHCIDMLREVIMCSGDVTPITFYDDLAFPARKTPMPDFSTLHTCRNFDTILEWNRNNERTIQWDEIGLDLRNVEHGTE